MTYFDELEVEVLTFRILDLLPLEMGLKKVWEQVDEELSRDQYVKLPKLPVGDCVGVVVGAGWDALVGGEVVGGVEGAT